MQYMKIKGVVVGAAVENIRIQHFLETYFLIKYPNIPTELVPAKSKYPAELSGETKSVRKHWCVDRMREIYLERGDEYSLDRLDREKTFEKKDDLADASLLILAHAKKYPEQFPILMEDL
jgi:hypothetical protein